MLFCSEVTASTAGNEESSLGSGWQWLLGLFPLLGSRQCDLLSRSQSKVELLTQFNKFVGSRATFLNVLHVEHPFLKISGNRSMQILYKIESICLEFQIMNLLLLPAIFATPSLFPLVPHCGQIFKGAAVDSGFLGRTSISSTASGVEGALAKVRSTCSLPCFACGSISGMVACDCGLTSMTVVGFSSPVPLTIDWSPKHMGTVAQIPCTTGKAAAGRRNRNAGWLTAG